MIEIIASIVFFGSIGGAGIIIARKMPQAMRIADSRREFAPASLFLDAKKWIAGKMEQSERFKDFSWPNLAQKQLLKARVVVLKAENKINDYMARLRDHSNGRHEDGQAAADKYWYGIKNIIKTKQEFAKKPAEAKAVEIKSAKIGLSEPAGVESIAVKTVFPEKKAAKSTRPKRKRSAKKKKTADPFAW